MWDDLERQIREGRGQGLSLRQTKAEMDSLLASSVGLRKLNEVVHALAPGQQTAEWTDSPLVVRLDGLWIKLMETTGEVITVTSGLPRHCARPVLWNGSSAQTVDAYARAFCFNPIGVGWLSTAKFNCAKNARRSGIPLDRHHRHLERQLTVS